jgi:predicted CoA-substrate-specific enzyme activase
MITAGVDVGIENIKAVVVKDGKIIGKATGIAGGAGRPKAAEAVFNEALKAAKVTAKDISKTVATGQGKWDARFANDYVVETVADTKAALALFPKSRSALDIGADQARAVRYDANGKILQYMLNQKCTAGLGLFVESLARTLETSVEELSKPTAAKKGVEVSDQCGVFAELDVVGLVHNNTPKTAIVGAVQEAVAVRLASLVNEMKFEKEAALFGGMAKNTGVVDKLSKRLGIKFQIPADPEFVGAFGAALVAAS